MKTILATSLLVYSLTGFTQPFNFSKTIRFDYYHTGHATVEIIAPDQWYTEGAWPGPTKNLAPPSEVGLYQVEISDQKTGALLFRTDYNSIFGEYVTTDPGLNKVPATFHETVRFPAVEIPAVLAISKWNADSARYFAIFKTDLPKGAIRPAPVVTNIATRIFKQSGTPQESLDLLVLGDGFTLSDSTVFFNQAGILTSRLLDTEPFKTFSTHTNVRFSMVPAEKGGIPNPRKGEWTESPLGFTFNYFGSDRYVLSDKNREIRNVAGLHAYDALIVIANTKKYGGGGIYNLYAVTAAFNEQSPYVFVHEFGHSFAALGDEYYTSQVAYQVSAGPEVRDPNLTTLPSGKPLKWAELADQVPIPTPWNQSEYDSLMVHVQKKRQELITTGQPDSVMEKLFRDEKKETIELLTANKFYSKTGAFEGGGYLAKGVFRPSVDCIMFSRNPPDFCRVCAAALTKKLRWYTGVSDQK